MIGSRKNRVRLAKALNEAGFLGARDTTTGVLLGRLKEETFEPVFNWPNGRAGGYLQVWGTHKSFSGNIGFRFCTFDEILEGLIDRLRNIAAA